MKSWKNWHPTVGPYDDIRAVRERALKLVVELALATPTRSWESRDLADKYVKFIIDGVVK